MRLHISLPLLPTSALLPYATLFRSILNRGPNTMKGYWQNEDATKEMIDEEGWLHTGDVGKFENGMLKITDRIKHMIVNAGGKNIYPGHIEDTIKTSP